jgi:hypothetical protein
MEALNMKLPTSNMKDAKGIYSTSDNPLTQPSRTSSECGPGGNRDQQRANRNLKKAFAEKETLRGKSGI